MSHVVTVPSPPWTSHSGAFTVHQIPAARDNFVWLVAAATGEVAAVDGPDAEAALAFCEARGLPLTMLWNTHTHGDHVGINRDLAHRGLLAGLEVMGPRRVATDVPGLTTGVDEGDEFSFGGVTGRVLLTEGHLDGHISFLVDGAVFCGDTLFGAGCGYLFDGPPSKMHTSLQRLGELDAETRVFCAHEYTEDNLKFAFSVEPDNEVLCERIARSWALRREGRSTIPTTVGLERATNPFLRHHSPTLRENVRRAMPDLPCETPLEIFTATRALKDRKDYKSLTDADLPLGPLR
jgi:hydroxyacylglutathione hydrolase